MSLESLTPQAIVEAMASSGAELRQPLRAAFRRSYYFTTKVITCHYNEPNLLDKETFKESCDWLQWVITTKKRGLFEDPRGLARDRRRSRPRPPPRRTASIT